MFLENVIKLLGVRESASFAEILMTKKTMCWKIYGLSYQGEFYFPSPTHYNENIKYTSFPPLYVVDLWITFQEVQQMKASPLTTNGIMCIK